ncbi:hypothetical protein DAPPUDRAFT_119724 [Daphnia pulex]|uniref:Uncharacterized protein n=1 Tax=Daphnia pulex TaxID=6669 RepID=E9HZB5_DAPPU|nr:hypothetical protein DAPPUDRAFT_119724 [Daphnia pulex]|eukprot:EFX62915.1 hypothetical protein DAPPUDRAFT_119724 [Daphnia pulex]
MSGKPLRARSTPVKKLIGPRCWPIIYGMSFPRLGRLVFPTDFTLLSPYDSAGKVGQSSEPQHMERMRKCSVLFAGAATPSLGLLTSFGNYCYPVVDSVCGRHHRPLYRTRKRRAVRAFPRRKLCVPSQWIEECRAVKSLYAFNPKLHATSLLAAELYSQAHDVICDDELAPETILSETYLELEELLAVPERFSTIADWYLIRAKFIGIISQLSKP